MDSKPPADKYLGPMTERSNYWHINGRSYSWWADTFNKNTGAKEPGGYGGAEMLAFCPTGQSLVGGAQAFVNAPGPYANLLGYCRKTDNTPEPDSDSCGYGNPIHPESALKVQVEIDYRSPSGLEFVRTYRSDTKQFTHNFSASLNDNSTAGQILNGCTPGIVQITGKAHCFRTMANGEQKLVLKRPGISRTLEFSSQTLAPLTTDNKDQVTLLTNSEWRVYNSRQDSVEIYSPTGRLLSVENRQGQKQTLTYDGEKLASVTDSAGRTLQFAYNQQGQLERMTNPNGGIYTYEYDSFGNMSKVNYPADDSGAITSRVYHYENANNPFLLTGITDENNDRYATFAYDNNGKAISTEHVGGVNRYTFDYTQYPTSIAITDPLGTTRTSTYTTLLGVARNTGLTQSCASCNGSNKATSYDSNGNVKSRTDFNGNRTNYTYDLNRNLETQRVEGLNTSGAATPATRTITTEWHPTWRLPKRIAEPLKITTYYYHGDNGLSCGATGSLCKKTIQATTDANGTLGFNATTSGTARNWLYTYNSNGQILTENAPRTDVNDTTSYTYYSDTTTTHRTGDLWKITNALGHVTQITNYNAEGRPLSITDPNGVITALSYTPRGKLKTFTHAGLITTYSYDGVGQLTKTKLPDGREYTYGYDAAHRLTSITSKTGEKLTYVLDNAGNRLSETLTDASGNVSTQQRQTFDTAGQLYQSISNIQGIDATTTYSHDAGGNLETETSPTSRVTTYGYDALERLKQIQTTLNGSPVITQYAYNGQGVPNQTIAPNNATTSQTTNGLGETTTETSPDQGTTTYAYDSAGNTQLATDARGQYSLYYYDALNRVTQVTMPTTGQNITYSYDSNTSLTSCTYGKGRLCKVVDQSGTTAFAYDARGNITKRVYQTNGVTYTTSFTYDSAGRLMFTALPGGNYIAYSRDNERRVSSIGTLVGGTYKNVLTYAGYRPDGQPTALAYANGEGIGHDYDKSGYRIYTLRSTGAIREQLTRNLEGELENRTVGSSIALYQYDALGRLKLENHAFANQGFTYDLNGNRQSNGNNTYTYVANSNRMATRKGVTLSRDAAGNYTSNGLGQTYAWDGHGHLSQFNLNSVRKATYLYNYQHQRTHKNLWDGSTALDTTVYHYDLQGHLLMETSSTGVVQATYIYDEAGTPIAIIQAANSPHNPTAQEQAVYLHTDHLGTPRMATDSNRRIVWKWESDAFGSTLPQQDPDADGKQTIINLRFPGQYYDAESSLHQNWHRTYDPSLGRYISSDPIGLVGGLNTYGYVEQNPLVSVDPNGLNPGTAAGAGIGGTLGGSPGAVIGGILGTVLGGTAAYALFHDDASATDNSTDTPCENNDPKCSKASKWQLRAAKITDEHKVKDEYAAKPWSHFDLCACEDGSIVIKQVGTCGTSSPIWETTDYRWK
ncbi:MAG: RHS repeat-associated core domain-containing protein [Thiothrix sp.]